MSEPRPEDVAEALHHGIAPSSLLAGSDDQGDSPDDRQQDARPGGRHVHGQQDAEPKAANDS